MMESEAINELIRSINSGATDFVHWVTTDAAAQLIGQKTLAAGYVVVMGILGIIIGLVLLWSCTKTIENLNKCLDKDDCIGRKRLDTKERIEHLGVGQVVCGFIFVVGFIITAFCLPDFLSWLLYPQGQLLKYIISLI